MILLPSEPVFLAGPTAIGKSDVALELAQQLDGEIISVDSMQVYRGMDLGTAKPSAKDRNRVPHHLLDVVDLTESFDAARFVEHAKAAVKAIETRNRVPLFCGGTGLYFKAYLGGLGDTPPADPAVRAALESTPVPELLEELKRADPVTHASIDRNNPRRVIRALEVIRLTGQPMSARRADWSAATPPKYFFALTRDPGDLRRRIERRVDAMFAAGLVGEVRRLMECGLATNRTALQALGYRQVAGYLAEERSLEATLELVKIRTWQFARRQMTWFRRKLRPEWLHIPPDQSASATAARILARLKSGT